ncbi:MAG: hypothetical protein WD278_10540 [Pirellulales bacterium]
MATSPETVLDELLDPVSRCLTTESAEKLVGLRAPASVQARIDELGDKSNEGVLSPEERDEYEAYVGAIKFISVLQSKARALLKDHDLA